MLRVEPAKTVPAVIVVVLGAFALVVPVGAEQSVWPVHEWSYEADHGFGSPFDVRAQATFVHDDGETIETALFWSGRNEWRLRFLAERTGRWRFEIASELEELDGRTGEILVTAADLGRGRVVGKGSRWAWSGSGETFVPQLVMYKSPTEARARAGALDADIELFLGEHGFSGFQVPVYCRWFHVDSPKCSLLDREPDLATFEVLERIIESVYRAGGTTHLWMWGDAQRGWTPTRLWGGINGSVDRRLQRYIGARLGALPGWSMNYGFDLWEWVEGEELDEWYRHMNEHLGWPVMLGARSRKNKLTQLTERLDYASYEQHRPDYDWYVRALEANPEKPVFSEDRFRIRPGGKHAYKDYDFTMVRQGMWRSALAGGVANIWGDLSDRRRTGIKRTEPGGDAYSRDFEHPEQLATYARVVGPSFPHLDQRCGEVTSGHCLKDDAGSRWLVYQEATEEIAVSLPEGTSGLEVIAIDAAAAYRPLDVGTIDENGELRWAAPHRSDWVLAIGLESLLTEP